MTSGLGPAPHPSALRRATDVLAVLVVGTLLLPMLALVAALVFVTMGRPILFRQRRSGRGGAVFQVCKFRTMRHPQYTGQPDVERTPWVGTLLRRLSIDELPQLWNIMRGDMSLIGPRPTLPTQVACYSEQQRGRLAVRPGLTGWAQVNGRNTIDWPTRIELDLWYIENRSVLLDLRILVRTAGLVLGGRGVVGLDGVNPGFPGAPLVAMAVEAEG